MKMIRCYDDFEEAAKIDTNEVHKIYTWINAFLL